MLPNIMIEKT